jgi:fructose-specific phosphotransferase system IIA component
MILTKILKPGCIKVPLESKDKESAIRELIELLDEQNLLLNKSIVLEAILIREHSRSTGIGSGVAIPHCKCKGVNELVMAVGISPKGIDFESVDDKPVKIIVLLASPLNQTGLQITALASISKLMLDEEFKQNIEQAESSEKIYDYFMSSKQ